MKKSIEESYYLELEKVKKVIQFLKPETLNGFNSVYTRVFIDGDLFYTSPDLLRPLTESEIVILLTEKERKNLIKRLGD
jgi:hypothetical protein